MKAKILLNYGDNTKEIEEEEKNRFLRNLFSQMGLLIDFWDEYTLILDVNLRTKLRKLLSNNNIQIIDDLDGNMKVYLERDLIGNWEKPTYKLKKDLSELNHRKQLYVEMEISYWDIFHEGD